MRLWERIVHSLSVKTSVILLEDIVSSMLRQDFALSGHCVFVKSRFDGVRSFLLQPGCSL